MIFLFSDTAFKDTDANAISSSWDTSNVGREELRLEIDSSVAEDGEPICEDIKLQEPSQSQVSPTNVDDQDTLNDSETIKRGRFREWTWDHFILNPENSRTSKARCRHCSAFVSARNERLRFHLEKRHPKLVKRRRTCPFSLMLILIY